MISLVSITAVVGVSFFACCRAAVLTLGKKVWAVGKSVKWAMDWRYRKTAKTEKFTGILIGEELCSVESDSRSDWREKDERAAAIHHWGPLPSYRNTHTHKGRLEQWWSGREWTRPVSQRVWQVINKQESGGRSAPLSYIFTFMFTAYRYILIWWRSTQADATCIAKP